MNAKLGQRKYGPDHKRCWKCKTVKPNSMFSMNASKYDGLSSECKPCHSLDNKWNNKQRFSQYAWSPEEFDLWWRVQGECCAICKTTTPTKIGWTIDHDHETGHVRGILCSRCNSGLGLLGDDPDRMRLAAAYVSANRIPSE